MNVIPFRYTIGLLAVLAAVSHSAVTASAIAQTSREISQQITDQFDVLSDRLAALDYVEDASIIDDQGLQQDTSRTWSLTLEAQAQYIIAAVCDDDCNNIELELWEGDTIVQADRQPNPYPRVTITPNNQSYRATIIMRACQIEPCYSGLRVFKER